MTKNKSFLDHLDKSKERVDSWPAWKKPISQNERETDSHVPNKRIQPTQKSRRGEKE